MTPLGLLVAGYAAVVLDFRLEGVDVVADPVGWVLVLVGLLRLVGRSRWFTLAAVAAGVGFALGIPQLVAEPDPLLSTLQAVVELGVVFGTCSAVAEVVPDPAVGRTARWIRWCDVGLTVAVVLMLPVVTAEPVLLLPLVLLGLALVAWFLIFLLSIRDRPELQHPPLPAGPARR